MKISLQKLKEIKQTTLVQNAGRFSLSKGSCALNKTTEILVCTNTSCLSCDGEEVIQELLKQIKVHNLQNTVKVSPMGCVGLCSMGPVIVFKPSDMFYLKVKVSDAERIIKEHVIEGKILTDLTYKNADGSIAYTLNESDFRKPQHFVTMMNTDKINPFKIEDYIALDGYFGLHKAITQMNRYEVICEILNSGLRGRGGAGFPTGKKWEFAYNEKAKQKYVICNADEGDPGAFMNRSVLESNPHSVLEGMAIAGYAIGANRGIIYVREEYALASEVLEQAIVQAKKLGVLGKNIFGTDFNFDISLSRGAGAFVCGEETALIKSVEGRRGEPYPRPPHPTHKGLYGKPTIVNNVETLANIAQIILKGSSWYSGIGSEKSKGTKVFALSGKVKNTGLVELPLGTPLKKVIFDIGGGIPNGKQFKAVQMGGPSGGCIPKEHLDVALDYDTLNSIGSMMGSGGMIVIDQDTCIVDMAKFFLSFTCHESCGKCTPCRIGNKRMFEILQRITDGKGKEGDIEKLISLGNFIKENSLCGLGKSAPNPVLSSIKYFRDEYEAHIKEHRCPAGVCKELTSYEILTNCVGCGVCKRVCPTNAISGELRSKHTIDQSKCIKCGLCYNACKFKAIMKGGAV